MTRDRDPDASPPTDVDAPEPARGTVAGARPSDGDEATRARPPDGDEATRASEPTAASQAPTAELTLGVDPGECDRVADLVIRLGGDVLQRLPAIGVLSVRVDARAVAEVARLDGVRHVERERTFQLPPPDEEVQ